MSGENRLVSLDIFRGVTIAAMILVNDPGSWTDVYPQLRHAAWHGWTMTDMIFPFFLWIMGVAMTFSFARRVEEGASRRVLLVHAFRRALVIFALGIVVNGFPFGLGAPFSLATLRIPGVLQRIAVCFLVVTPILLTARIRTQAIWAGGVLALYWALVMLVPVPGHGQGILEPIGGLCWYVDSSLLGGHTWIYAPAPGFDPEGIVSTLPAIATTIFGVLTGHWLRTRRPREEKAVQMFVAGFLMVLAGQITDMWLPINKNLWTSSYAVFMGGWALVCFASVYWIAERNPGATWWRPFTVFGQNAIALYVASELLATLLWVIPVGGSGGASTTLHEYLHGALFSTWLSPVNGSLAFATLFVLAMWGMGWALWKKGWFIKV